MTNFAEWPQFVEQVKTTLHEHGQVAIFIWEPCASWLQESLGSEEYNFHFEIPLGMDLQKKGEPPPVYSVMDIVCKADDTRILQWLSEERKKTSGFFARLKTSIKQLQSALKEEQFTLQPVPTIARYLHMPEETVRWRLRRLDFSVRFYD